MLGPLHRPPEAHDNLSNQLSPALLYGGKSEAQWLIWGPSASPWLRGIWNKACLTQGLCASEHITCEVSPRCWKEGHSSRKECLEENQLRLSWAEKEANGHGDPLGTRRVSRWKYHSQHNSHVSKADSAGVLRRWGQNRHWSLRKTLFPILSPSLLPACLSSVLCSLICKSSPFLETTSRKPLWI